LPTLKKEALISYFGVQVKWLYYSNIMNDQQTMGITPGELANAQSCNDDLSGILFR